MATPYPPAAMSPDALGHYLGSIQDARAFPALRALANEIAAAYPTDEATPALLRLLATKVERLAKAN